MQYMILKVMAASISMKEEWDGEVSFSGSCSDIQIETEESKLAFAPDLDNEYVAATPTGDWGSMTAVDMTIQLTDNFKESIIYKAVMALDEEIRQQCGEFIAALAVRRYLASHSDAYPAATTTVVRVR